MSQAEEHLPIDMRKSRGGIGSGARENRTAADARGDAVDATGPSTKKAAPPPDDEVTPPLEECPGCEKKADKDWNFCPRCSTNLIVDPAKELGITFDVDDLDQYLFNGTLNKTMKLVGRDLVLRTSKSSDHRDISDYLMAEWKETPVTEEFWRNIKNVALVGLSVVSFDGKPIGTNTKESVEWMLGRGSAFTDMVTNRVVLFNQAVTAWLDKKNTFLAS